MSGRAICGDAAHVDICDEREPVTGEPEVLLLRGAADKRLWANRYNGLGGHVEAGEDVLSAAKREAAARRRGWKRTRGACAG